MAGLKAAALDPEFAPLAGGAVAQQLREPGHAARRDHPHTRGVLSVRVHVSQDSDDSLPKALGGGAAMSP